MLIVTLGGIICRRFIKGVADFVVAGRNVRKYLALSTMQAEGLGLISIAVLCQEGFERGLSYIWLSIIATSIVVVVYGIGGFVIVRFRRLKIMTIPQYYEMRYSRGVRITVGVVSSMAGIFNLCLFPAVGTRFLINFIGLPEQLSILGYQLNTAYLIAAILIGLALFFTYIGGMVSVVLTDYLQSILIGLVIFITTFIVLKDTGFVAVHKIIIEKGPATYNPFSTGSYGVTWMTLAFLSNLIGYVAFAPNMQKIASVDSEKTVKTIALLGSLLAIGRCGMILFWGIAAAVVIGDKMSAGMESQEYSRAVGAFFLASSMPRVIKGIALAGMLAAFISTVDSYMLAWSAIIVNDVIAPIKKKPMSVKGHLWALRLTVAVVGLFLFLFSVIYKPSESIMAYILITGAMFLGAGIIMIGGIYWKRASVPAAYTAVIVCCVVPLVDVVCKQIVGKKYFLTSEQSGLIGVAAAIVLFIVISLLSSERTVSDIAVKEKEEK